MRASAGVAGALAAALVLGPWSARADAPGTPPEHRRGEEQTFLTFPEWFLVYSPEEYAAFVRDRPPSDFPFLGHVGQLWSSYLSVLRFTRGRYPPNLGYHAMILVIGVSTTLEYSLRAGYEGLLGRLTALSARHGMTAEDRFGARAAADYVDFLRERPWYEFDFLARLRGLWTATPALGPDMLRKWERRYALTTEYAAKALYGRLIGGGTRSTYERPILVTAAWIDRLPPGLEAELPELRVLARRGDGSALVTLPRYAPFTAAAATLAARGVTFREIAGNHGLVLVSALGPAGGAPPAAGVTRLFSQPILTRPGRERVALATPVGSLAALLRALPAAGYELEHVYDY